MMTTEKSSPFFGVIPNAVGGVCPCWDRLDLLDHGVPLLNNHRAEFRRPTKDEVRQELRQSIERSWKPKIGELSGLTELEPKDRKPYIRAILYPARLIFSWDNSRWIPTIGRWNTSGMFDRRDSIKSRLKWL